MILVVFLALASLVFAGCGSVKDEVLAEVDGKEITREDLNDVLKMVRLVTPDVDAMLDDEGFKNYFEDTFLRMLVDNKLVKNDLERLELEVEEAELEEAYQTFRSQLVGELYGSEEEFARRMKELRLTEETARGLLRDEVAATILYDHLLKDITDDDLRAFAEEYNLLHMSASVTAHHILLKTEDEALEVLERLQLGDEDFADVAEEVSTDPSASQNRGKLGKIFEDDFGWDEDFKEGAFSLEEGEISQPVNSQFGWHIIFVEERSDSYLKDFEAEKMNILMNMEEMIINDYFDELWQKADIQVLM